MISHAALRPLGVNTGALMLEQPVFIPRRLARTGGKNSVALRQIAVALDAVVSVDSDLDSATRIHGTALLGDMGVIDLAAAVGGGT